MAVYLSKKVPGLAKHIDTTLHALSLSLSLSVFLSLFVIYRFAGSDAAEAGAAGADQASKRGASVLGRRSTAATAASLLHLRPAGNDMMSPD